jgi:hypothetical protein
MNNSPGYISANEIYRLAEAKRRMGFGRTSFRELRAAGLKVLVVGRNSYINGADLIDLLNRIGSNNEKTDA